MELDSSHSCIGNGRVFAQNYFQLGGCDFQAVVVDDLLRTDVQSRFTPSWEGLTHLCATYYVQQVVAVSKLHHIACTVPAISCESSCICLRIAMIALADQWPYE